MLQHCSKPETVKLIFEKHKAEEKKVNPTPSNFLLLEII